jgi:hypothetical protein
VEDRPSNRPETPRNRPKVPFKLIQNVLQQYLAIVDALKGASKHPLCKHNHGCIYNCLSNGTKLFTIGFGIQCALKLLLQGSKLARKPSLFSKIFLNKDILKLGLFFGGFSATYRMVSCLLRHLTDKDHPSFAIPGEGTIIFAHGTFGGK